MTVKSHPNAYIMLWDIYSDVIVSSLCTYIQFYLDNEMLHLFYHHRNPGLLKIKFEKVFHFFKTWNWGASFNTQIGLIIQWNPKFDQTWFSKLKSKPLDTPPPPLGFQLCLFLSRFAIGKI